MQNLITIAAAAAVVGTAAYLEPAGAVPYPAQCQFNQQQSMACTVSSNPFTWRIDWADGVSETYVRHHTPNTNTLVDELRRRLESVEWMGQQEVLTHANGNRITINFRK